MGAIVADPMRDRRCAPALHYTETMAPPAQSPATRWTTRELLAWLIEAFSKAGLDSPRLLADMLLTHTLGVSRLDLYTSPDRPASDDERTALRGLAARALRHEPVQYLVGEAWFFGMPLHADRRALIPRPSSETIVETVLQSLGKEGRILPLRLADICTGTGAIVIALVSNLPNARAWAVDLSPDALALARENTARHALQDRITLLEGDLTSPIAPTCADAPLDLIVANPPYIPDEEWPAVPPNVKHHEPHLALRGGPEGLDLVRRLLNDAPGLLRPGGDLLIEIATSSAAAALAAAQQQSKLCNARVIPDGDGLPRLLVAQRIR